MSDVRILIWHGYLLGGTGSNVYTRSLAREWSRLGHDVTVFCQEPHPERYDLAGARVVRPAIGPILPVFVLDTYEDVQSKLLQDTTPAERERVVEANARAMMEHLPADFILVNHVLLGAPVGVQAGEQFAVKVHGSELEFSIRGNDELTRWARVTLAGATEVYVGSEHIQEALADVIGPGPHERRVRIIPPGVDVDTFCPQPREQALAALIDESRLDPPGLDERQPDQGNAERFATFFAEDAPVVAFVGKLSREKGVHLLVGAIRRAGARAVVVGFGDERQALERQAAGADVLFTGALGHRHLARLLPLTEVAVTPSVFPEAFGMVAAEAAASGVPPLVARHSGLAAIAEGLEAEYPAEHRQLASFESGSVDDLTSKLEALLGLAPAVRQRLGAAARRAAVERWSWRHVGEQLLSRR